MTTNPSSTARAGVIATRDYESSHRLLLSCSGNSVATALAVAQGLLQRHAQVAIRVLGPEIPKDGQFFSLPVPLRARISLLRAPTDLENAAFMAETDIFIGLDRSASGLKEALAAGVPVIASASASRELIIDGDNGLLAKDGVAASFINAADRLISNSDLRRSIGVSGQQSVLANAEARNQAPRRLLMAIHVNQDAQTAVYQNAVQVSAYLGEHGWRCALLGPETFPWLRHLGARFRPLLYPIALAFWLVRNANRLDIICFHSYSAWAFFLLRPFMSRLRKVRTVIQFHGLEPLYFARLQEESIRRGRPLSWRYRLVSGFVMPRLIRYACRHADLVQVLNSQERKFLIENRWAEADRTSLNANPVPVGWLMSRTHKPRATQLLFVGQWLPMKGTYYLAEAFAQLHARNPDLRLTCAGTLADAATVLRDFPEEVRPFVTVFPRVTQPELFELHRTADIFVFPTLSEGFSLALIEAMASGLPIVTTPVGAAPDLLEDAESAMFCPPQDPQALADSLTSLLVDLDLRKKLGTNARQISANYDRDAVWSKYAERLDALLPTGPMRTEVNNSEAPFAQAKPPTLST
jgi:glycosyltransferase involved in cell wall biosynthesis